MLEQIQQNWAEILNYLRTEYDIADISYKTWISPIKPKSYDNNLLTLEYTGSTSPDALKYINKKYIDLLSVSIKEYLETQLDIKEPNMEVEIIVAGGDNEETSISTAPKADFSFEQRVKDANLNSKYTFDSFVVGANNNIAQATSLAVAESPGEIYNPLFIYGGVGLGKTHLLQAIGIFILKNYPDKNVLYTTTEAFTNEFIDLLGIKKSSQEQIIEFRNKYRNVDVLLLDDIQFISNKDRTQEELFNIFNDLFMKDKQIVITSDKKPKDLEGIPERLINRFEKGLTVDIQNPDYETRMAILKKNVDNLGLDINEEVLDFIANNFTSNVRELEGSLTKIVTYSKITRKDITLDFAADTLKDSIDPGVEEKVTCEDIINIVADHFNISVESICSKKRTNDFAYPRQICMYLCRIYTDEKLETIALALNKKNHATISHGYEKIEKKIQEDPAAAEMIEILKKKISPN